MNRKLLTPAIAALAVVAAPGVAGAAMTYVSTRTASASGNGPIMLAADDGSGAHRVASGGIAEISPDGTKIAYQKLTRDGDAQATTILELATGATTSVTGGCVLWNLAWSPDSTKLLCQTQRVVGEEITGEGLAMASVPTALGGVASIAATSLISATGNHVGAPFTFSPDSTQIAFSNTRGNAGYGYASLYRMDPSNPAGRTRILARADTPVWGPSGLAVARYSTVRVRMGGGIPQRMPRSQVWVANPDGTGARQVTHWSGSGPITGPAPALWNPAGNIIIGTIGGDDTSIMFRVPAGGGRITQILGARMTDPVAISPTGATILYRENLDSQRSPIGTVGISGTGRRILARSAAMPSVTADWNP